MAWRIDEQVVRGELDNRVKGKVMGRLWLAGRAEPLRLELAGNPWRDWAGCVLRFTNSSPQTESTEGLAAEQIGVCGDMTVSRKVRITPRPVSEWLAQGAPGVDSLPWGNAIYIEWYSQFNGRVVIESTGYIVEISDRAWSMSEAEENEQRRLNLEEMKNFMGRLEALMEEAAEADAAEEAGDDPETLLEAEERQADRALELIFNIEELKRKARELAGGEMIESREQGLPLDLQHQFWQNVVDFESAPRRTRREILVEDGFEPPPAVGLSDEDLTKQLWRLIDALAVRKTFLQFTNHLSDRELYILLTECVLDETTEALPPESGWNNHIDIHEYGTPEDEDGSDLYLRYYADEATRARWAADFDEPIPPHCDPPFDRDRHLPGSSE